MNTLVSQLAHDIKNPVGNCMMYNEMMQQAIQQLRDKSEGEELDDLVEFSRNIKTSLNNLMEVLDAWVIAHQIVHQQYQMEQEPVSIKELLEEALGNVEPYTERKKLRIINDWNDSDFTVATDQNILKRIIQNMVMMLITFADREDSLRFSLKKEDTHLKVTMEDSYTHPREVVYDRFTGNETWVENEVPKEGILKPAGYGLKFCGIALTYLKAEPQVEESDLGGLKFSFKLPV